MRSFILLMVMIISSCRTYDRRLEKFEPEFHLGKSQTGSIERDNKEISCLDPQFNDYACMHIDKVKELSEILTRYRRRPFTNKAEYEAHKLIREMEKNSLDSDVR